MRIAAHWARRTEPLDPQDVGAEVGEQHRAERSWTEPGKFKNANVCDRRLHAIFPFVHIDLVPLQQLCAADNILIS
ncbi:MULTISPECIES: hypothetical protein [unclassified Sphingopyxis]|uniref:hypothetical protein n=1 Tax=unclassified Sphingopyxis TaxID=2614943 RepID=UPI0039C92EDB